MKDANGKEADELLEELHRDFDGRRCVALRHKRTKVAFGVMFGLIAILGVSLVITPILPTFVVRRAHGLCIAFVPPHFSQSSLSLLFRSSCAF
jgi:hypothetical protein